MSTDQAQSAVSVSAFVVAVIFGYRKLVEQPGSANPVPSNGHFVIGFGFTYIMLSLFAQAAPTFGGMMAVLVAAGDILANGKPLVDDVTAGLKATQAATAVTARPAAAAALPAAATLPAANTPANVAAANPAPGRFGAGLVHGRGTILPGQ